MLQRETFSIVNLPSEKLSMCLVCVLCLLRNDLLLSESESQSNLDFVNSMFGFGYTTLSKARVGLGQRARTHFSMDDHHHSSVGNSRLNAINDLIEPKQKCFFNSTRGVLKCPKKK